MNLENSIKDCISKELEKGVIEKVISEKLEECIASSVKDMFGWNGEIKKVIEEKVKSVMIPYLESYDYSDYITKLDYTLVEVLKNSALENKKVLMNFKELMIPEKKEVIKSSELFEMWINYVAKNVTTDELEVEYDDEPSYESVEVSLEVEHEENRSWSTIEAARLIFECEHDEEMNFEVRLLKSKDRDTNWIIDYKNSHEIDSLRHLNEFELSLIRLNQNFTKVKLDTEYESEEVQPEEEPEASFY